MLFHVLEENVYDDYSGEKCYFDFENMISILSRVGMFYCHLIVIYITGSTVEIFAAMNMCNKHRISCTNQQSNNDCQKYILILSSDCIYSAAQINDANKWLKCKKNLNCFLLLTAQFEKALQAFNSYTFNTFVWPLGCNLSFENGLKHLSFLYASCINWNHIWKTNINNVKDTYYFWSHPTIWTCYIKLSWKLLIKLVKENIICRWLEIIIMKDNISKQLYLLDIFM